MDLQATRSLAHADADHSPNIMSDNKRTVERYMDGFRHTDRSRILSCLTEDVEWEIPGYVRARGMAELECHIVDEGFTGW